MNDGNWIGQGTVVAHWACQACKRPVPVTDMAAEAFERCNSLLVKQGQAKLKTGEVMFCDECRVHWLRKRCGTARIVTDKLRDAIQRLKKGGYGRVDQEREDIAYVEAKANEGSAIVLAIMAKRNEAKASRSRAAV